MLVRWMKHAIEAIAELKTTGSTKCKLFDNSLVPYHHTLG